MVNRFTHGCLEGRSILSIFLIPFSPSVGIGKPLRVNAIKSLSHADLQDLIRFILLSRPASGATDNMQSI